MERSPKSSGVVRASGRRRGAAALPEAPRQRVVRWIRESICNGTLGPGDPIPPVRALAAMLGTAVNPTAEAVVDAEKLGLVVRHASGAHKRYVPTPGASLSSSTVCVLGRPSHFIDRSAAPRWSDPFIASELFGRLSDAGFHMYAINSCKLMESDIPTLLRPRPAGLIAIDSVNAGTLSLRVLERCREEGVPAVAYGNAPALRVFDRVFTDHRKGAADLTRWLLERGCRKIVPLFPVLPADTHGAFWIGERLAGYGDAMREAGLEPFPCAHFGSPLLYGTDDPERFRIYVALAFEQISAMRNNGGVDAIICQNDEWAKPPIAAIGSMGLVPNRDILIAGYDNISSPTSFSAFEPRRPAVTIDKHNEHTAEEMAELLVARIYGTLPRGPQSRTHAHELVVLEV